MKNDCAPAVSQEAQGVDARVCRHLAACMGVVSFAWILSAVLALCVLWLRAIGLFGQRPDLGQAAWQGAACVLLLGFGVLTNLPALAFRKAAATPQVEATHLVRALRRSRLLYALHAGPAARPRSGRRPRACPCRA